VIIDIFIVDNFISNGIFNMLLLCMWACEKEVDFRYPNDGLTSVRIILGTRCKTFH